MEGVIWPISRSAFTYGHYWRGQRWLHRRSFQGLVAKKKREKVCKHLPYVREVKKEKRTDLAEAKDIPEIAKQDDRSKEPEKQNGLR